MLSFNLSPSFLQFEQVSFLRSFPSKPCRVDSTCAYLDLDPLHVAVIHLLYLPPSSCHVLDRYLVLWNFRRSIIIHHSGIVEFQMLRYSEGRNKIESRRRDR